MQYTQELGFEFVQITEKYLKHIFGIEIEEVVKRSGLVKKRLGGFHHDYLGYFENQGLVKSIEINNTTKVKKGVISFQGVSKESTFFPNNWTKEECLKKINESLSNITEKPIFDRGAWEIIGSTGEGMQIKSVIKTNGELITSYPLYGK